MKNRRLYGIVLVVVAIFAMESFIPIAEDASTQVLSCVTEYRSCSPTSTVMVIFPSGDFRVYCFWAKALTESNRSAERIKEVFFMMYLLYFNSSKNCAKTV